MSASVTLPIRRLRQILDVILRVPPLFLMDSVLLSTTKFSSQIYEYFNASKNNDVEDNLNLTVFHSSWLNKTTTITSNHLTEADLNFQTIINNASNILMTFVFSLSLALFLLSTDNLINFYKWLISIAIAFSSYLLSDHFVKLVYSPSDEFNIYELLSTNGIGTLFLTTLIAQVILALTFTRLTFSYKSIVPYVAIFFSALPYLEFLSLFVFSTNFSIAYIPTVTLAITLIYLIITSIINLQNMLTASYGQFLWAKTYMRDLGLFALIESQWNRLHVPQVFRVFWLTRLLEQALFLILEKSNMNNLLMFSMLFDCQLVLDGAKHLLVRGCETLIAVLGMTSVLSGITHQIGCMMQNFLMLDDPDDRSISSISAILFFILALQNGLTSMEPEKRMMRLYRNFCLLFTAILHFIHNMVSPLLFSLSASRNMSLHRHCRALFVCLFLIISPYMFLNYLWVNHNLSTWLLAVSSFGIEVIVKVIITLLIYTLFMIDAFRSSMWEQLDDYVYYVRTIGNLIEFVFGIFLFLNGAWILVFESGGTIRALMMCIHVYFNIWCQAIAGLKTFFKRYHALRKINSLPEASQEQLDNFDDVCSICYQELTSARITKCNHYFHSVCLRKWLYLQDICPLCHKTLYV